MRPSLRLNPMRRLLRLLRQLPLVVEEVVERQAPVPAAAAEERAPKAQHRVVDVAEPAAVAGLRRQQVAAALLVARLLKVARVVDAVAAVRADVAVAVPLLRRRLGRENLPKVSM